MTGFEVDRVAVETAKGLSREELKTEPFEIDEMKNDVPSRLLSQLFRLQATPIAIIPSVIPAIPSKLDPFSILWTATKDLFETRFRYFRADIRMVIKINSTPLDYGFIGISWYPSDTLVTTASAFSAFNADPWLFPISCGGTHEIIIPYCSVYDGYSCRGDEECSGFNPPRPQVYLAKYGGGTLANTYAVSLTIEVGWHNIKCWGVPAYPLDAQPGLVAEGQMLSGPSVSGALLQGAQMFNTVSDVASAASNAYKTVKGAHQWTREAVENVNSTYNDFKSEYEEAHKLFENVSKPMYDLVSWKEEAAVDGSMRNAPTPFGGMTNLGHTPIENFSFSQVRVDTLGLCDENREHKILDIMKIPCIHTFAEFTTGTSITLLVHPFPGMGFGAASNTMYGNQLWPDYLAQGAQFFRKIRGSIDYSFLFDTSSLVNGQVTIRCDQLGSERYPTTSYNPLTDGRYLFKRTEQLTGHTRIDLTVPFIFNSRWCPNQAIWDVGDDSKSFYQNAFPSRLIITVEDLSSSAVGTGAVPKVELIVLRSAGSDFQVSNFVGGEFDRTLPAFEGQMRVREKPMKFENLLGGSDVLKLLRPVPEDKMTFEDIMKRWSTRRNPTVQTEGYTPHYSHDMSLTYSAQNLLYRSVILPDYFDYVMNMFRYVRGNIQFRMIPAQDTIALDPYIEFTMKGDFALVPGQPQDNGAISSGTSWCRPELNPILEFEAPVEAYNTDWLVTGAQADNIINVPWALDFNDVNGIFANDDAKCQVRSGNSFQVAFIAPPMEVWFFLYPTNNQLSP